MLVNTFAAVEYITNPAFGHNITCMGFMAFIAGSAYKFRICHFHTSLGYCY